MVFFVVLFLSVSCVCLRPLCLPKHTTTKKQDNGGDYFYQLLTAAGLLATVDKTIAPYTIFAPSNAAVASAIASGQLDVGGLFGRDPKVGVAVCVVCCGARRLTNPVQT